MGKGNLIIGTGRGKLGDVVFYRTGGEQRYRARVKPRNPRSNAQILQRVVVATAVKFYSEVALVCDHAFQNYTGKMKNNQRYMKLNIKDLRELALDNIWSWSPLEFSRTLRGNWSKKDSVTPLINQYIISEGDLNGVTIRTAAYNDDLLFVFNVGYFNTENVETIKYIDVVEKMGLQYGDQVTMIVCTGDRETSEISHTYIGRVILAPNENGDENSAFYSSNEINYPNKENYGQVTIGLIKTGEQQNQMRLAIVAANNEFSNKDIIGAGAIISRYENGAWRRSSARMFLPQGVYNNANIKDAMYSYMIDQSSSLYLNQSDWIDNVETQTMVLDDNKEIET